MGARAPELHAQITRGDGSILRVYRVEGDPHRFTATVDDQPWDPNAMVLKATKTLAKAPQHV